MKTIATLLALALVLVPAPLGGQELVDPGPGRAERTREDLERLLAYYDEALRSTAYSGSVREEMRLRSEAIRQRLEQGDFKIGDRIALRVQGEEELPDTVLVEAGPSISLSLFGDIPLGGVLRSEVEEHLTQELGRFIRNPVVEAKALMRVSVQGAVGSPGFYVVPADMLLSDAIMVAGGPAADADIDNLRIERGSVVVMEGAAARDAIQQGRTLDQLNLQAGDQLVMPLSRPFTQNILLITGIIGSVASVIYIFTR